MTKEPDHDPLLIGPRPLEAFGQWLQEQSFHKVFILTDTEVAEEAFPMIQPYVENQGLRGVLSIPPGEASKTLECCEDIWQNLIHQDATRNSLLINLGGGLISDLGGFIAKTFKRGMPFANIPTTLLGMVDASIGGKTGINFKGLKNQIGVYAEPVQIAIAPDFLNTLEDRQVISGYAEMIKHALIADKGLWEKLQMLNPHNLSELTPTIYEAAYIKQKIVQEDPYESGARKKLNFGHTIGHAVETYSQENDNNPLLHGEAIAIGMRVEAYLSTTHVLLDEQTYQAIEQYLSQYYPAYSLDDEGIEKVLEVMKADKKRDQEAFNFTLLVQAGQADTDLQLARSHVRKGLADILKP